MIRNAALLLALSGLSGCLSLASSEVPPNIYAMHYRPAPDDNASSHDFGGVLKVQEPDLPAGFETDRIALYLEGGRRLDYYAGAKWPEPLDQVLQDAIVQAGHHALPKMTVDTQDIDMPADYKLAVKVVEFGPVYANGPDGIPHLEATMIFTLIRLPDHNIIADFTLENGHRAEANDLTSITSGLESLLHEMMVEAYETIKKALE
ncbi:MAG: ABC-type transport auxiliary lipoprotein family protein [Micavibrio sp.]